jgi:hypothetical protein
MQLGLGRRGQGGECGDGRPSDHDWSSRPSAAAFSSASMRRRTIWRTKANSSALRVGAMALNAEFSSLMAPPGCRGALAGCGG